MRLLDRYLLRELLIPFAYCLIGFLIFWIVFNLFNELSELQKHNLNPLDIAQYYLVKTSADMWLILPVALLLALLYALTNHARHQELTAIRAAGVSLWRLAMPYLAMGFLLSLGLFALNELWVPNSSESAERILQRYLPDQKNPAVQQWEQNLGFINERANRTWLIQAYDMAGQVMIRPHIDWTLANGTRHVLKADRAYRCNGVWIFTNVQELIFSPVPDTLPTPNETNLLVMAEFSETPEQIETYVRIGKVRFERFRDIRKAQFSIREILDYERVHPQDDGKRAILDTKLHGRLAAPWTCLVVVLIALPFGAASGRRNVFVGVASSILICFAYFVLLQVALAVGSGGIVPPWVAAWAPNVLFGISGLALTWRVR
jgi:lipopolysaccharide export system permease protein